MRLSSHGFLGFAAMTASTVHEAIDLATRFASTRTSALGLALYVEGDTAKVTRDGDRGDSCPDEARVVPVGELEPVSRPRGGVPAATVVRTMTGAGR